jgi:D-alanyl-D-alanine carboxypeptidase
MEKGRFVIVILLLAIACQQVVIAQARYKGGAKHTAPPAGILPDAGSYDIHLPVSGVLNDSLHKKIRTIFTLTGMPGITAAMLVPGKGLWCIDTGFISLPDRHNVDAHTVFYWASVAKLITATIITSLIREHKLDGGSRLDRWFPQIQDADKITIDALLQHTSGIYSFNADTAFHEHPRYYAPQELIDIAVAKGNGFPPGQYWSYSNTGYLLLAMIAEKTEGKTYADIVQERIAAPLQLTSLRALQPRELPANLALAHEKGQIVPTDYSVPLGAGNIVGNARDMVVLLYALLTGQLSIPEITYSRLRDLYPMYDKGVYYGKGIMLFDFKEISNVADNWIGHSGGTETYRAILLYDTATRSFVAIAVNQHIPVEAIARKMLEQIR